VLKMHVKRTLVVRIMRLLKETKSSPDGKKKGSGKMKRITPKEVGAGPKREPTRQ